MIDTLTSMISDSDTSDQSATKDSLEKRRSMEFGSVDLRCVTLATFRRRSRSLEGGEVAGVLEWGGGKARNKTRCWWRRGVEMSGATVNILRRHILAM